MDVHCSNVLFPWVMLGLLYVTTEVHGACSGVPQDKVVNMCTDQTGGPATAMYMNASDIATYADIVDVPLCHCDILTSNIKLVSVRAEGNSGTCGTTLTFMVASTGQTFVTPDDCTGMQHDKIHVDVNDKITVVATKVAPPFINEYCVSVEADLCPRGYFQCDDGECISEFSRCDSFPDCNDMSDEEDCEQMGCLEGQVACLDGSGCYTLSEECDNITRCRDFSDKIDCLVIFITILVSGFTIPNRSPSIEISTKPRIQIFCEPSDYTTTSTTTTTHAPVTVKRKPTYAASGGRSILDRSSKVFAIVAGAVILLTDRV